MKINRVSITGFMGIDRADLRLDHVNVFFGPNGIGKSSILEGILLAIFGETARQLKKKDWPFMIRYPASKAEIFVQVTEGANGSTITHDLDAKINQKSTSVRPLKTPDLFDQVLLNPLAFFDLPAKIKADLAGDVRIDPQLVASEMAKRGLGASPIAKEVVDIIIENRLTGAEKVLEQKRLMASRCISDPGEAPHLTYNQVQMDENITQEQIQTYRANVISWDRRVGELEEKMRAAAGVPAEKARRDVLRDEALEILNDVNVPSTFKRQGEMDAVTARYAACTAELNQLTNKLNFDKQVCAVCGSTWSPNAPGLSKQLEDTAATQRELFNTLSMLQNECAEWKARRMEQAAAESRLNTLGALPPLPEVDMAELQKGVEEARAGASQCRAWLTSVESFLTQREMYKKRVAEAEFNKGVRAQWDSAVKIIRDPEFKARLVSDPLGKARARLEQTAKAYFDMEIHVDNQLDVSVNGRPWWLLSTAQKLQASVALADAFAYAGGSRILSIDGVDTLVGSFQQKLVMFLRAVKKDYDTILLALALETGKPPAFTVLEALQTAEGGSYQPLASWFWVHTEESGVTATFRRVL